MKPIRRIAAAVLAMALGAPALAGAAIINDTEGNASPGFNDGDTPTLLDLLAAQGGQPAPFDAGIGNELIGPNFGAAWMHTSFGPITDPIVSATMSIGIADHDSAAGGDQVASFLVDGADGTGLLNGLFNGTGGGDNEYNVYSFDVLALIGAPALADGTVNVSLALQPPGLQTNILFGGVSDTDFNAAFLIFSSLEIVTQDQTGPPVPAPAPATLALLALGLLGLGARRRG